MMNNTKKNKIAIGFLFFQWLFIRFISNFPDFIERYYSNGIYLIISRFFRIIFGWIPFSIGDVLYIVTVFYIFLFIVKIIKERRINFTKIVSFFSIIYFCFHFFWGINYFRKSLSKTLEINKLEYATEELKTFTLQLIDKTNSLQFELMKNDTIKVSNVLSKKEIYAHLTDGYDILSAQYPQFKYKSPSIKHSFISLPLSYMGFSGYLNPFTGEAQVNSLNPSITYAVTSCHEVAHQLGYAAENEANFIGFLAAINNENRYFQYSGYYMALRYALNDLYLKDKNAYTNYLKKINKGVLKNMQESHEFWNSYENSLEIYFKKIFNQFLKVNGQPKGIKSYNAMLGMLINYQLQHQNQLKLLP